MLNSKPSFLRWLMRALALVWALALTACANTPPGQPKPVRHSFSFDGRADAQWAKKADLLAYIYGDQYLMTGTALGEAIPPSLNANGPMPVGDFLYVKWRIKATGEVLENQVDLRSLLPKDMTHYGLTFVPDERQLYVYLITPTPKRENDPPLLKTAKSRYRVTYEIYPHNTFPHSRQ